MNLGNAILHLSLQARNLAVTLESDLSHSHPTYNPLPSSAESSPQCLSCVPSPLPGRALAWFGPPAFLCLCHHHGHLTAGPAAVYNTDT